MTTKEKIVLTKEKKQEMVSAIKAYFKKERDEEIGDLAAGLFLSFIIEKMAPEFYNQGVFDSYRYMGDRIDDLLSKQI